MRDRKIDHVSFLAGTRYHIMLELSASHQCYIPSSLRGQPPHWVIDRGKRQETINRARWRTRD